jgi:hypothetical protein
VLVMGQSDLLSLAALSLALLWIERKPSTVGVLLGITAFIKYQTIVLLPFLLLRSRWKAGLAIVAGMIIGALLPALSVGWSRNFEYLTFSLRGIFNIHNPKLLAGYAAKFPSIISSGNISLTNGILRIFTDHGLPLSAAVILIMAIACIIFILFWRLFHYYGIPLFWRTAKTFKNSHKEQSILTIEWCILLGCLIIFSPQCLKRHTLLLLEINLLAVTLLVVPQPGVSRWPIFWGLLIAQLGYDYGLLFPKTTWYYLGGLTWVYLPLLFIVTASVLKWVKLATALRHEEEPAVRAEPPPRAQTCGTAAAENN